MSRRAVIAGLVLLGLAAARSGLPARSAPSDPPDDSQDAPRDLGLEERTGRTLAQLDVTVEGPRDAIGDLSREDFELVVGGRFLEDFVVDNLCRVPRDERTEPVDRESGADVASTRPPVRRARVTYLFYFDQHHLTRAGRQNSLDIARTMIRDLVVGGNRALIVSAGREVQTFADLTEDVDALEDALRRLEKDTRQFDPFPSLEELRIREVLDELQEDTNRAVALARRFQQQERWNTEKALRLFASVLARLADVEQPKAAIYFADTMRANAGAHYLSYFGSTQSAIEITGGSSGAGAVRLLSNMQQDAFTAYNPFNRALEEAAANGVRLYTVQAEGLTTGSMVISSVGTPTGPGTGAGNRQRFRDAQDSLAGLALETGGQHFLNGVAPARITERVRDDLSCVYLISFDAERLPRDESLPVRVRTTRPKVKARVRGQIVVQSERRRDESRILAAFASPRAVSSDSSLRGVVIPTGFVDGKFSALVQIAVPASPLAGADWDVGASLVSRGKVREDAAGHVTLGAANVPLAFETEMSFSPGPYELIAVAHETRTDEIVTGQVEGEWPDPDLEPFTLAPFVVLQPAAAAFWRDGAVRHKGALAPAPAEVRVDLPTALVGIVCRQKGGRGGKKRIAVERRLVGATGVDFPAVEVDFEGERCAQIRDTIRPNTMTAGSFVYEVLVQGRDGTLASTELRFFAVEAPAAAPDLRSATPTAPVPRVPGVP